MKLFDRFWMFLAMLAAVALLSVPAQAQTTTFHKTTKITFSGPVEMPGRTLPAGTYTFLLNVLPTDETRLIEVRDGDNVKAIGTFLVIPDYRMTPTSKTVMLFEERESGKPQAVRAWFYPGEQYGYEFVYPAKRAAELASANHVNVPSMPDNTADQDIRNARVSQATADQTQNSNNAAVAASQSAPAPNQNYQSQNANQNTRQDSNDTQKTGNGDNLMASSRPLPKTASNVYTVILAGSTFMLSGLALAVVDRRRAAAQSRS